MEQIRSFIAIELPGEVKSKFGSIEDRLKSGGQYSVKWVKPDSIHLTLKFLGNIETGRVGEITGAIEKAAGGVSPFTLRIEGLGAFPSLRKVQVAWVGLGGELDILNRLQQSLESELESLGFPPENRSFTPHLTLARANRQATPRERQELGKRISEMNVEPVSFGVKEVGLIRSQLTRQGAIYTRIAAVRLKKVL